MTSPKIKIDLDDLIEIFQTNGAMSYNELAKATGINYHTIRRYCQILIEQGRIQETTHDVGGQTNLKEKRYRATNSAYSLDYPKAVWPDKSYMSISRFPMMIIEQNNAEVEFASGKQYKQVSKWITLILNEALQQMKGIEPNLKAVVSYRNSIDDTLVKLKEMIKVIELFMDQEVMKPGEIFGLFPKDEVFQKELGYIMQAMNIITGELVYPEAAPKETNVTEV
jgi:predicted transcriptional regulator